MPAVALALATSLSLPAIAQEAPAAAAKPAAPAAVAPADGQSPWVKLCNTDPASKKELCLVIQEVRAETGQFIASATIRQITGDTKMSFIAAVPPGMLIQPGLRAQVDNGKQYPVKYGICYPNACYGELEVDAEFIGAMKNGKQLVLTTLNQQAKGVSFPLSLAGFTKTMSGKGLDAEGAKQRQDDLNKALQARAELARKKLIEQQQKEAAPVQ